MPGGGEAPITLLLYRTQSISFLKPGDHDECRALDNADNLGSCERHCKISYVRLERIFVKFRDYVINDNLVVYVRGLLDTASKYSYVTKDLVKRLCLPPTKPRNMSLCTFATEDSLHFRSGQVRTTLAFRDKTREKTLDFLVTPIVPGDIETLPSDDVVNNVLPRHYKYGDPDIFKPDQKPLHILIGNNYQFDVLNWRN